MHRTHTCGELTLADLGKEVTLSGWIQKSRDLGGMTFIDMRDRYGITQLTFNSEENAELCTRARELGREFRSEEHTSELQSLMRNSYAVFCCQKQKQQTMC